MVEKSRRKIDGKAKIRNLLICPIIIGDFSVPFVDTSSTYTLK